MDFFFLSAFIEVIIRKAPYQKKRPLEAGGKRRHHSGNDRGQTTQVVDSGDGERPRLIQLSQMFQAEPKVAAVVVGVIEMG